MDQKNNLPQPDFVTIKTKQKNKGGRPKAWKPIPFQKEFIQAFLNPQMMFLTACIGRQAGKTEVLARVIDKFAKSNPDMTLCWSAPTADYTDIGFRRIKQLSPRNSATYKKHIAKITEKNPRRITYTNGTVIHFRTLHDPDSVRGETYDLVVIDEARELSDYGFNDVILATVAATGGKIVAASTPGEKNWFYDLFVKGQQEEYPRHFSIKGTTLDNLAAPGVKAFVETAQHTMTSEGFRREILAEFLEDGSDVFRNVKDYVYGDDIDLEPRGGIYQTEKHDPNSFYSMGIDVAKIKDWTVICVVKHIPQGEETLKKLVYMDRFRGETFKLQKERVLHAWKEYGYPVMTIDATGKGDAFIEELKNDPNSIPERYIVPYMFTRFSKGPLIERLQSDMDHGRLLYPRITVLLDELSVYKYDTSSVGFITYSAPKRKHDDCVIALALACFSKTVDEEPELIGRFEASLMGF